MAENKKDKRTAIVVTIVFHAILLLSLSLLALVTPLPLPGEEGVEVHLGYSDQGMGIVQTDRPAIATPEALPQPKPTDAEPEIEEAILLQDTEEAPTLQEKEEKKTEEEPTPKEEPVVESESHPEPEPPKPVVNQRALFRGSDAQQNEEGKSEGVAGNSGDQGNPHGLRDVKRYDGQGGKGNGLGYSLGGRGSKYLEQPKIDVNEQGNVVVDIWVDRKGNVKKAEINVKYTNVIDSKLRQTAVNAALKSTFAEDPTATELQKGTITYTFIIGG
ncbi:MAG: hypothetical protein LBM67_04865 [Lentimicrobiaceae bacterium]|jgi:outer membrane biosynthesis protein TonB|nr:hypothetical protein [Lentimicrobiaceae bacterium]